MAPQVGSGKLRPQQQHALIQRYKIFIEGPIRARDWPKKYATLFGLVRDTEKVRYDEYCQVGVENDNQKLLHMAQMRSRVENLVRQAHRLRGSQDKEDTWRLETEHLILERFTTESDCHVCGRRRWISDLQALPSSAFAAAKLHRIRSERMICSCEEISRANYSVGPYPEQPFVTKANCTMVDRSMPEIQRRSLTHHKPDRVLGLGKTQELERLLAENPRITASITENHGDAYFPFLILEAKSEKNTVGFESIERQTAFPIRAMINTQKALETASAVSLNPLVWFLANRGDEWRVYGCVPDRHHIRIIDLWHGCILRHDSALQLFLIIDLLCDWARDIFMEHVLSCLKQCAGPNLAVSGFQATRQRGRSRSPKPSVTSDPTDRVAAEASGADHEDTPIVDMSTLDTEVASNASDYAASDVLFDSLDVLDQWSELVAIKSEKDVQLQFRCICLPETRHDLYSVLRALGGEANLIQSTQKILALFNSSDPFIIQSSFVDRLQRAWGKPVWDSSSHTDHLLYAALSWRASFDYMDWVVTKELSCITASSVAIAQLTIIGEASRMGLIPEGGIRPTTLGKRLIHPLRYLPLAELVQAASRNQSLYLQVRSGLASPGGWIEDHDKGTFSRHFWDCLDFHPQAFSSCTRNIYSNVRGYPHLVGFHDDIEIPPPLQVPEIARQCPIALLTCPSHLVDDSGQLYSIFLFDRWNASASVIGSAVRSFLLKEANCFYGNNKPLTAKDRKILPRLAETLLEPNLPPNAMQ